MPSLNEFQIISRFIKPISNEEVILGKGDDCSVIHWNDKQHLIETTDCLVEDVHFRLRDFSLSELAFKALAVNVSDISAMGGKPKRAHLNLALPKAVSETEVEEFFLSFNEHLEKMNIDLVGGDLSASPGPLFINLHISGEIDIDKIKWRKGLGETGVLCVTGPLGSSAAGLWGMENLREKMAYDSLIQAHKIPPVLTEQACWLSEQPAVSGMMDLSDGLYSDLHRLSSGKVQVDVDSIPMVNDVLSFAALNSKDPLEWALCGGEDYQLLIKCQESAYEGLVEAYEKHFGASLFKVGEVWASDQLQVEFLREGELFDIPWKPFDHF